MDTRFNSARSGAFVAFAVTLLACSSSNSKSPTGGSGGSLSAGAGNGKAGNGAAGQTNNAGAGGHATAGSGATGSGGKSVGNAGTSANGGEGGASGTAANGGGGSGGSGGATSTGASVLERNNHPSRDGLFIQPTLTKAAVAKMASDANFKATFGAANDNVWASPLYLENGPNGKGVFIIVTTNNMVYAIDESTGATVWPHSIGTAAGKTGAGCGSIAPIGIISTPVIDGSSRTIYVAGAIGDANGIMKHEVHALSADDGTERSGWPVDVSKVKAGSVQFTPSPQNQRSALSLVNGTVYVAYGGHVGDCGNYHGWVVGIDAKDPTKLGAWATQGTGEAIWAAGGLASDGTSVFAVTGNSKSAGADHATSDGEEVVRLSGLAAFDRQNKNLYFPMSWKSMDQSDSDFGASNPVYLEVPGAMPSKYVVAISKDGHLYMLDSTNLGGMAGHKVDFRVATGTMAVRSVPAVYTSTAGVHMVFSAVTGSTCMGALSGMSAIMSVQIAAGSPPAPKVVWCAAHGGTDTSPIVTTTDGTNDPIVWSIESGKLTAVDGDSGQVLYTSSDTCSGVRQWTSPIAVKGRIVVAGDKHLCSWSPH